MVSLQGLRLSNNQLTSLPAGLLDATTALEMLDGCAAASLGTSHTCLAALVRR
jgi:Leucine-rich repeat (LRR) protein